MPRTKKTRRVNLPQETLERARAELRGEIIASIPEEKIEEDTAKLQNAVAPKPKPKRTTTFAGPRRIPTLEELIGEYSYVLHDLRRLVVLAAALLALIVVASLVLPRAF